MSELKNEQQVRTESDTQMKQRVMRGLLPIQVMKHLYMVLASTGLTMKHPFLR